MTSSWIYRILAPAALSLVAGGCLVPTRHGPVLIAPVPHGVAAVRVPGPAVPHHVAPIHTPAPVVPHHVYVPAPAPILPHPVVRLLIPPPAIPRVHVVKPPRPHPQHVWVDGHHAVEHGVYVWKPGIWVAPPRPGALWVPPRTVKVGVEWHTTPGYWK
jgi:hypothetical protein